MSPAARTKAEPKRAKADSVGIGMWFLTTAVLLTMVRVWLLSPYVVPSGSMEPTIPTDSILVAQRVTTPERGDLVVFDDVRKWTHDQNTLVKRLIGVGGDVVSATGGKLFVNGEQVDEPYVRGTTNDFSVVVPEGFYFFAGDNRNNSFDSRCNITVNDPSRAFIPEHRVRGVVWLVNFKPVEGDSMLSSIPKNTTEMPFTMEGGC